MDANLCRICGRRRVGRLGYGMYAFLGRLACMRAILLERRVVPSSPQVRVLSGVVILLAVSGPLSRTSAQEAGGQSGTIPAAPTATGPGTVKDVEAGISQGTAPKAANAPQTGVNRASLRRLLLGANPMLWPLAVCSVITLGYALERGLALRRKRVIPGDFVDRFLERIAAGKLDRDRALELCKANDSPTARVFALVVKSWGQPGLTIRQTLQHDAASEIIELKRNLRVLNAMATIGPLLGLLGTVVGIIQSFDALGGRPSAARGEALAQGISLALVATAFGLGIAIFAVASYYFLLNRIDVLVRELDERTRQVIELVSSEAARPGGTDRRHVMGGDTLRPETRVH